MKPGRHEAQLDEAQQASDQYLATNTDLNLGAVLESINFSYRYHPTSITQHNRARLEYRAQLPNDHHRRTD